MPDPCVSDSNCIDLALTGSPGALVANLNISTDVGNRLECRATGAYARDRTSSYVQGPGVAGYEDFRVKQRGAGANMSVDVGVASTDMWAWLPDSSAATGYRTTSYEYNGTQLNAVVTASDATNPRIDIVTLRAPVIPSLTPTVVVTAGAAAGGATLDNRTGAAATPSGDILLADVLVPALSVTVVTANIRNRRQFPRPVVPPLLTGADIVTFSPPYSMLGAAETNAAGAVWSNDDHDTLQAACLMFLPRRITAAAILFRYRQIASIANTGNYRIAVHDASGRLIVATAVTAFSGAANAVVTNTLAITSTTFEAGSYYVWAGLDSATAGGGSYLQGVQYTNGNGPNTPNVMVGAGSGGTATVQTLAGFTDRYSSTTGANGDLAVPIISLQA